MTRAVCIALGQSGTVGDESADLARIGALLDRAAEGGARLLMLPELDWGGYGDAATTRARALTQEALAARLAPLCRAAGVDLVIGYPEADPDTPDRRYNALLWVGADGSLVANYRKLHLWGGYESAVFAAGDQRPPVVERHGIKTGLLICFDIDHPQMTQDMVGRGVDLILAASATSSPYHVVPRAQIPTRAYENAVFFAFCNRCDAHLEGWFIGESRVASPDGAILAAHAGRDEGIILAPVDTGAFRDWRRGHDYRSALRRDLYPAP